MAYGGALEDYLQNTNQWGAVSVDRAADWLDLIVLDVGGKAVLRSELIHVLDALHLS